MSNGDDADGATGDAAGALDPDDLETRLNDAAEALDDAETEADLDWTASPRTSRPPTSPNRRTTTRMTPRKPWRAACRGCVMT